MTRILVPPGIGDGYWVLVKLRGFLEARGLRRADVWVHDAKPRRAGEMWSRVPFVRFGGYAPVPRPLGRTTQPYPPDRTAIRRAYRLPGYAVQKRACGFDYFLSCNGSLDAGRSLDQAMPGPTHWFEPMHDADATAAHAQTFRARFGRYVVAAFWEHGFYAKWLAQFGEAAIVETLRRLADAGLTVVVMGADWDKGAISERIAGADPRFCSLVGDTDFGALCGLLAGSEAVVGHPAGNTMLGPYFRRPTVLLWNQHFPRAMWTNVVPPVTDYCTLDTATVTPEVIAAEILAPKAQAA